MCHGAKIQNALSQKNWSYRVVHIKITQAETRRLRLFVNNASADDNITELPPMDYFTFQDEILKLFVTHFYTLHITESYIFELRTE